MDEMIAAALLSVAVQCNAESGSPAVSLPTADAASLIYDERL